MGKKRINECKREGCTGTFSAYPSQNKVYCSPACRYQDHGIVLARNPGRRHEISEIDPVGRRAVCSLCGPTDIRRRTEKRKYTERISWRCYSAERARVWARRDGIHVDDVEKWIKDQGNRCAICGRNDQRLNVDHDHSSGRRRGMLCNTCNGGLGFFKDNPDFLRKAAIYLEGWEAESVR